MAFIKPTRQVAPVFFNGEPPSDEYRAASVSRDNPNSPFHKFVGNERAVKRLSRAAFKALGHRNHLCSDQSFALLGPASTGKTTLAKMYAQLLRLPFVEIHPKAVKTANDILVKAAKVLEEFIVPSAGDNTTSLELVPFFHQKTPDGMVKLTPNRLKFPPCIIFIDEVHALPDAIVQALLKATEKNDAMLDTGKWIVDCTNVCWIIATTDRGRLFDAFDTRFTKIHLELYTLDEIARIVKMANPDWDESVCQIVARSAGRIPREALAFAQEMRAEREMSGDDWEAVARQVADDNNIDQYGMTKQRLNILIALSEAPIAKARLQDVAQCKEEELEKFVMPTLLASTADQKALVTVGSRGYTITPSGLAELEKRGIAYTKGDASPTGGLSFQ